MSCVETNTPIFAPAEGAARWQGTLPSLIVALSVYLLLICAGGTLLNDPDSQWHVAVGRWIWANGRVPTIDVFSHTFAGAPWIAKEWGSQVILFAAYRMAGWSGVVVVAAAAIALAFGLLHHWLRRRMRSTVALALVLVAMLACAPHLLARPHALVLPIMVLWVAQLVAARERDETPPLWLTLLMALWANLHGSFPLGLIMAGVLAGEGVVLGKKATFLMRLRDWSVFGALAVAATLLSPYGWQALLVPLKMASGNDALPFITEWQPLDFDLAGVFAIALLGAALCMLAGDPRKNLFRFTAIGLLAFIMVRHSRFIDQFALLTPILVAGAIAARRGLAPSPEGESMRMVGGIAGALAMAALLVTLRAAPAPSPKMTPDAALQAAVAHHVTGPVYNSYDFGGFLIAKDVPTFIDGRTDQLFLGGFLTDLEKARREKASDTFAALLGRYHVTWALVRPGSEDARHFSRMPGWSELYADDVAAVFATGS